jgi:DnaJ-class molecular chaperone
VVASLVILRQSPRFREKETYMGRHDDQEEKCGDCGGDGGWTITNDGKNEWKKCGKCNGTGKKP